MSSTLREKIPQQGGLRTFSVGSNEIEAWDKGVGDKSGWEVHPAGSLADISKLVEARLLDAIVLCVDADIDDCRHIFASLTSAKTGNSPILLSYGTDVARGDQHAVSITGAEIHAASFDGAIECLKRIEKHLLSVCSRDRQGDIQM
ncbi:MAG: hypothetical protein HRU30_04815 [Rhodobacteraceae bacterium]|nr:hypothetical protein [Paracoccaceae bacterium]